MPATSLARLFPCLALVCVLSGVGCSTRQGPGACLEPGGCADAAPADAAGGDGALDGGSDAVDAAADAFRVDRPDGSIWVDPGALSGDDYLFVLDRIDLGAADPLGDATIVPGFDIDGFVSDGADPKGCRKADHVSPPPDSLTGVDNELGPLLAGNEASFGVRANLATTIASGELLVLFRIRGVDSFVNDELVIVEALFGALPVGVSAPLLDGAGRYQPGQTFDIDSRSYLPDRVTPITRMRAAIVEGRLEGGPVDMPIEFPFRGVPIRVLVEQLQLRFDIGIDGLARGVMGGALNVEDTVSTLSVTDLPESTIRLILEGSADLWPDSRFRCQFLSVALVFDGRPALPGVVVGP
ncbi:MAG: hypothetical protein OEY14_00405 [Myxococcales bacterium]|nr:hypothetical protein [Myxococcales bacterium]